MFVRSFTGTAQFPLYSSCAVFSFVLAPNEAHPLIHSLIGGAAGDTRNLPANEKRERIQAIEALLSDYQSLPSSERDRRTEAQLRHRLGQLFFYLGNLETAVQNFCDSLGIWEELGNRAGMASSYGQIAALLTDRGAIEE